MQKARNNKAFKAFAKIFSLVLPLAFIMQSFAPIALYAAMPVDGVDESIPGDSFNGTIDPTIAGCPVGKDCAVFTRNDQFGNWNPASVLSGGAEYHGSAGVRSTCGTSAQICREQGYEDVVCDPIAWSKAEWHSPDDNFQRDYANGAWTTYGAWGGNDEYWTKITCERPTPVAPVDVCPNISGAQATVPAGYTTDGAGDCVPVDEHPIGFFDSAACDVFNGWTFDPDEPAVSNAVHFYADGPAGSGTFLGGMTADQARPDVNAAYTITGAHGFSFVTPDVVKDNGSHTIYAYGINSNPANPNANNQVLTNSINTLLDHWTISGCTIPQIPGGGTTGGGTTGGTGGGGGGNPVTPSVSVSISGVPATLSIPSGGSASITITSTATVTGVASLTQHGIEVSTNGGVSWSNAGAWNNPIANQARTTDASFTSLVFPAAGSYQFRTYASINGGASYSYSSPIVTMTASISGGGGGGGGGATTTPSISSFSVSPTAITSGGTATLNWASSAATSCTASGAWSGAVALSGSQSVGPFTTASSVTTQAFTLACTNSLGTATSTVTLTVNPAGGPGPGTGVVTVTALPGLTTSENGSTAVFTVVLASAPLATVSIPVTSSDFTEGTTSATTLTFTTSSWNVPQTVTVTGIDDAIVDGNIVYAVLVGPVTSADINWNGVDPADVSLTNIDNDVSGGGGGGATTTPSIGSFSVAPMAVTSGSSVTLTWSSSNATLCVASNSWSGNQTVSGSQTVGPFTVAAQTIFTFDIACGNGVSTSTASTTLTVDPASSSSAGLSSISGSGSGGGGGGPCVGYGCSSGGGSSVPPEVWILIDSVSSGGSAPAPVKVCKYDDFLTSFMKRGVSNDPNEVRKLQYFLNTYEAAQLTVNGEFDLSTEEAVKAFQVKYTENVLSPWGTTTPTGIVYITTNAEINRIFCGDNPNYHDGDLKDIIGPNVLYTPTDNSSQFEGVVGFNSSSSTSTAPNNANIAGIIGAMSGKLLDFIGGIPWYPVFVLILVLLGVALVIRSILIKDIASGIAMMSLMRGAALLGAGTILNAMNTLVYMLDPDWFTSRIGFGLSWLLALDLVNLLTVAFLCIFMLAMLFARSMKRPLPLS